MFRSPRSVFFFQRLSVTFLSLLSMASPRRLLSAHSRNRLPGEAL
jgi:hypothetical protein